MNERLDRIEELVARIREMTDEVHALEQATAGKRAELGRLEAELATAAIRRSPAPAIGRARNGERRDQILALAREGLDRKTIRQRTGLPSHVVNAALRRLRLRGTLPDPKKLS
jgi:hypothetical protein